MEIKQFILLQAPSEVYLGRGLLTLPALFLQRRVMRMYEKLALELTALAFLFQCIRFIWKIEIERYKMRKKKPSTTANRRRGK